jgi:hypothetical protein
MLNTSRTAVQWSFSFKIIILSFIMLVSSTNLFAQRPTFPGSGGGGGGFPFGGGSGNSGGGSSTRADGKMLNDSAQNIYGPSSTKYFFEKDIFNNLKKLKTIDTSLAGFHNYNFLQRNQNLYTDLGNLGTAARATFFQLPEYTGAKNGLNAYDLYIRTPAQMLYFDTKSPYTNMYFSPGGGGQNILDFDFSRNIKPNFNMGFNLRRITAIKQFGPPGNGEDNLLGTWDVSLHGNYYSKNKKYTLLSYLQYAEHKDNDQGGISLNNGWKSDTIANIGIAQMNSTMKNTSSQEKRKAVHIYQEYKLANGFQAFYIADYQTLNYKYIDLNFKEHLSFYHPNLKQIDGVTNLNQQTNYSLVENKAGIKGFYKGYNYRAHVRRRDYVLGDSLGNFKSKNNENFIGLWFNYYFPDSIRRATVEIEVGRDQKLKVEYFTPKFNAGLVAISYSPSLMQQRYFSTVQSWTNNFVNTSVIQGFISTNRTIKGFNLSPSFEYNLIRNYTYFDTSAAPKQSTVPFSIFKAGLGLNWQNKRFELVNQLTFNHIEGNDVLRIPTVFANSRMAYNFKYAKVLFIQTGLEFHYRSSYKADFYNPLTQSFYLNEKEKLPAYIAADAFAVFRINRVRIFIKMSNIGQGILQKNTFIGPYLPIVNRTFGYGVNWYLFD